MQGIIWHLKMRMVDWIRVVCSLNGRLASFYYLVFSRHFEGEHLSVLRAKRKYRHSLLDVGESSALLRRNIHRLEKGLIMRPRRAVFAEKYISETVGCYCLAVTTEGFSEEEEKWARDVLDEYFSVVGSSEPVQVARDAYFSARGRSSPQQQEETLFKPYSHGMLPDPDIGIDQLEKLYTRRRSVRWFKPLPVPAELIRRSISLASLAPSACNRQSFKFLVTTDQDKAVQLADCAPGTVGFSENIPALIVVVGDLSSYPFEKDRHLIYIDSSLAVMQLMLALEVQGLSTCPINWPDIKHREEKLRAILDIPDFQRVVMLIAVGYADEEGGVAFSQKKKENFIMQELE